MTNEVYGYMFVDHADIAPELQAEKLGSATLFCDYGTQREQARPALNELLSRARSGDAIYVEKISRIATSVMDFYELLALLASKGVWFEAIEEEFLFRPAKEAAASALLDDLKLIKSMANLERRETVEGSIPVAEVPFWSTAEQWQPLSLEQVVTAEKIYKAGIPLARVAHSFSVRPAELFQAIRRDQGYSSYPATLGD